jgi:hypothetical protein
MIAEAIMEDRTGKDYALASHNAASIDLVAEDGQGMSRGLLKLAKRSLPMIILRDFELLVKNSIV